jgi:hypothetical protein
MSPRGRKWRAGPKISPSGANSSSPSKAQDDRTPLLYSTNDNNKDESEDNDDNDNELHHKFSVGSLAIGEVTDTMNGETRRTVGGVTWNGNHEQNEMAATTNKAKCVAERNSSSCSTDTSQGLTLLSEYILQTWRISTEVYNP